MANVIDFPTKSERDWLTLEKGLREVLKGAGAGKEMTDHLCSAMKDYYERYNIQFTFSVQLPPEANNQSVIEPIRQAAEELGKQIHETVYQMLFFDILRLHIELYRLRRSNSAG